MPHHRSRSNVLLVGILVTAFTCGLLAQGEVAPQVVRLALVNVPDDVLRPMLPTFNAQGRQRAEIVYTGTTRSPRPATAKRISLSLITGTRVSSRLSRPGLDGGRRRFFQTRWRSSAHQTTRPVFAA